MGDVHRLQVSRRLRVARPLTVRQSLEGVVADLERLPQHPEPVDVRAIAERLYTLAERLERDSRPGTHRET